jgi:hypothetical protein
MHIHDVKEREKQTNNKQTKNERKLWYVSLENKMKN